MSVERVREYLKQYGLEGRVKEFAVSSATVELAAQAVGVEAARIAKTLSFRLGETVVDRGQFRRAGQLAPPGQLQRAPGNAPRTLKQQVGRRETDVQSLCSEGSIAQMRAVSNQNLRLSALF